MKKIRDSNIRLSDIKFTENSRLRGHDDVADLMHDIEQHGLLESIGIREEDNALIFGNRRVKAFEKLGYEEIPCTIFGGVSDEDLLIINVTENIKRKNIGSIEIGRICEMLKKKGMTSSEISVRLGISKSRVRGCISSYNVTKGTPFESLVTDKSFGPGSSRTGIPEGVIWKVQTTLSRRLPGGKVTKEHWKVLLPAIESGRITSKNIYLLRNVLDSNPQKSLSEAIDILDDVKVVNTFLSFDERKLAKAMAREKITSAQEFVRNIVKEYDEDLLF